MINRGNYRRNLFGEVGGGEAFERVLGEAAERFRWRVHAYGIMRNHFHLAVELAEPNLSLGMKWLQGTNGEPFGRSVCSSLPGRCRWTSPGLAR